MASRIFYIDSFKSDTTLFTGMSYTINTNSLLAQPQYLRLINAQIPLTASNLNAINSTNNTFVINDGSDNTITLSTVTQSSVTASNASLVSDINAQLTTAGVNVTVDWNSTASGKFSFVKNGGGDPDFTLDFSDTNSAGPILGFPTSYNEAAAGTHSASNSTQDYNAYDINTDTVLISSTNLIGEYGGLDVLDDDKRYVIHAIPFRAIVNDYYLPPTSLGDLRINSGDLAKNWKTIEQSATYTVNLSLSMASNLPINSTSTRWSAQIVLL
jgi:hypothetical protein